MQKTEPARQRLSSRAFHSIHYGGLQSRNNISFTVGFARVTLYAVDVILLLTLRVQNCILFTVNKYTVWLS